MNIEELQKNALEEQAKTMLRSKCQITLEEAGRALGLSRHYIDLMVKNGILDVPYLKGIKLRPSDVLLIFLRLPEDLFQTSCKHLSENPLAFATVIGYYNMYATQLKDTDLFVRTCLKLRERFNILNEVLDKNQCAGSVISEDVKSSISDLDSIILSRDSTTKN